jgi:hypothetical protein
MPTSQMAGQKWKPAQDGPGCRTFSRFLVVLWLRFGFGLAVTVIGINDVRAGMFEAGGLVFSDELGGFRLISASGRGTPSDPIVLVEELMSLNPAVLTVRNLEPSNTGQVSSGQILKRSLIKIVVNRSAWNWSGFDLELRGRHGQASVYSDGLSFDQLRAIERPLHSDLFAAIRTQDEPYDRLRYDQGRVEQGQTVRLSFNLIDLNPKPLFFLAQEPIVLLTEAPGPARSKHRRYASAAALP